MAALRQLGADQRRHNKGCHRRWIGQERRWSVDEAKARQGQSGGGDGPGSQKHRLRSEDQPLRAGFDLERLQPPFAEQPPHAMAAPIFEVRKTAERGQLVA